MIHLSDHLVRQLSTDLDALYISAGDLDKLSKDPQVFTKKLVEVIVDGYEVIYADIPVGGDRDSLAVDPPAELVAVEPPSALALPALPFGTPAVHVHVHWEHAISRHYGGLGLWDFDDASYPALTNFRMAADTTWADARAFIESVRYAEPVEMLSFWVLNTAGVKSNMRQLTSLVSSRLLLFVKIYAFPLGLHYARAVWVSYNDTCATLLAAALGPRVAANCSCHPFLFAHRTGVYEEFSTLRARTLDAAKSWRANGLKFGAIVVLKYAATMGEKFDDFEAVLPGCAFHRGPQIADRLARFRANLGTNGLAKAAHDSLAPRIAEWAVKRVLRRADAPPGARDDEELELQYYLSGVALAGFLGHCRVARNKSHWRLLRGEPKGDSKTKDGERPLRQALAAMVQGSIVVTGT
ncbi:hypothetical protein H9P43_006846 [Blastocladiella emersonii ATCC 22665]|nr:hypothetical protein H9P43_006846 [Blastocladiella emersonii ATCC 22665]